MHAIIHECTVATSIYLHFDTNSKFISVRSQVLHHFVCWYVKCVEKVPFHKSGHFNSTILKNAYSLPACVLSNQLHRG